VNKQARVVEEVIIDKEASQRTQTVRDTVRRTEVDVEPAETQPTPRARDFAVYEPEFRTHYDTAFAPRGSPYDRWAPAYRYGYDLASDPHAAGRDWAALEPDARHAWEAHHQGTWETCKDTIRYAWETVRGRHQAGRRHRTPRRRQTRWGADGHGDVMERRRP